MLVELLKHFNLQKYDMTFELMRRKIKSKKRCLRNANKRDFIF